MRKADSSYFHVSYSGKKVLVLVPHQDDEINVAAISIQNFVHSGAEVFVAYSTNGDNRYSAETRIAEALASLSVLGVKHSNIFILGYGDTMIDLSLGKTKHIFDYEDVPLQYPNSRTETYGISGVHDFAYLTRKEHSKYCRRDYLRDLRELILYVKADIILCVDFDYHVDHRMLSLSFETVMGEILSRPNNDYMPEVFKRFAYSTAWYAVHDFFSDNLKETQKPSDRMIDSSCYSWDERVRIPAPENSRCTTLKNNTTAFALRQHKSQQALCFAAEAVINSDEIFFRRCTDSLTYSAKVTASSGKAEYVNDFMLLNVSDIYSEFPKWENYLWIPEPDDKDKIIRFHWEEGQRISYLRLWGNIEGEPVKRIKIFTDTGHESEYGPLPARGLPLDIKIPEQLNVTELTVKIIEQGSTESGFSEIEIFEHEEQKPVLMPFIQITSSGNFIYDYRRKHEEKIIPVECYSYRVSSPVHYDIQGPAHFDGMNLVFDGDDDVILRAYTEDNNIFCQSVFHTASEEEFRHLHSLQRREQKRIKRAVAYYSNKGIIRHIIMKYTKIFKDQGIVCTFRRIAKRITDMLLRR